MHCRARASVTWTWTWRLLTVCLVVAEAATSLGYASASASICDLGPCACNGGRVQCDCSRSTQKEIILEAGLLQDFFTSAISVSNCEHVHVKYRAFSDLPVLQQVSMTNIGSLSLEEQAFSWTTEDPRHSGLAINISRCAIPEVPSYTFRGALRDILLTEVNVSRTRAFSFSAIDRADRLHFSRVSVAEVEPQTFKKFRVNFLIFTDCRISKFPSRTIINVDVDQEVRFENMQVGRIKYKAIQVQSTSQFKVIKTDIDYIERGAFVVHTKGDVTIRDSTFLYVEKGAFLGITVDSRYLRDAGKQDFVFENNTFAEVERAALTFNTTGFEPSLDRLRLARPCVCADVETWTHDVIVFSSDPNASLASFTELYCLNHIPTNIWEFQRQNCQISKFSLVIKVLLTVGALVALVIIGTILYCTVEKKGKRYINVPTAPSALKPAVSNKAHMLVVPDGKTYRETELHVIVEHVEPIVPTEYVKERQDGSE